MKIAIVGPQEDKWTPEQKVKAKAAIYDILLVEKLKDPNTILVSGACPMGGVDLWSEIKARSLNVYNEDFIFKPEVNQWLDLKNTYSCGNSNCSNSKNLMGYKSRNIKIAETCDVLYCIVPYKKGATCYHHKGEQDQTDHPNNGGCWARNFARKIGKETHLVVIE